MLVEFKNFQLCLVPIKCKGRKIENKKSQEKYKIKNKIKTNKLFLYVTSNLFDLF